MRIAQFAFDGAALRQVLQADGVPALVRYRMVNGPPTRWVTSATLRACATRRPAAWYPAVQATVISLHRIPGPEGLMAVFVIHPAAMPPGSVLYVSTALIHTSSPRPSGAFTTWVLKQDRLPDCAP